GPRTVLRSAAPHGGGAVGVALARRAPRQHRHDPVPPGDHGDVRPAPARPRRRDGGVPGGSRRAGGRAGRTGGRHALLGARRAVHRGHRRPGYTAQPPPVAGVDRALYPGPPRLHLASRGGGARAPRRRVPRLPRRPAAHRARLALPCLSQRGD
ncbi:MAG: hypothetical protein AVDCRST_MAG38-804, partial [uncultured Solirubrobacteraceae bacterium]